jgi:uncharacterized protein (DUF1330 family)
MSCYFVAQIQINDMNEYQKYLDGTDSVFTKYNGKYLAVDTKPEVLEGDWLYGRIIIIEFEDEKELKDWYESPEYQSIMQYRLKGAKCDTLLVHGLESK